MKVAVLGGTRFIGRAIVEHLAAWGDEVLVVHRGSTEPPDLPDVEHIHAERATFGEHRDEIAAFAPDAVVDCLAMTRAGAEAALAAVPDGARLLVLSSVDVYRAYSSLLAGTVTDAVPLAETAPVRTERYPFRGQVPGGDEYEKLDVEEAYLARGAIVARLPMVYGPRDGQRREWFVLRRVRAGRRRIPVGAGSWVTSRVYAPDVGAFVRAAIASGARGEIFNVAEAASAPMGLLVARILRAAGSDAACVTVPDDAVPEDLGETRAIAQHLLVDASKARALGWRETDPDEALRRTVAWHLENPPQDEARFDEDDRALAAAGT